MQLEYVSVKLIRYLFHEIKLWVIYMNVVIFFEGIIEYLENFYHLPDLSFEVYRRSWKVELELSLIR